MRFRSLFLSIAILSSIMFLSAASALANSAPLPLKKIKLPPGFRIAVYARVPNARSLALSPSGIIYVGNRDSDTVYAVMPGPSPQEGGKVIEVAHGFTMPNGVAYKDGALYVADISRIFKFPDIEKYLGKTVVPKPELITDKYPTDQAHGWKFIAFGPDGWLYVPVGAPCNICEPKDPYASITRIRADGTGREVVARGVRNTVGFDWDPATKQLWFTDNGRDNLGDNSPPDELNHMTGTGLNFGYPYCHGGTIVDPDVGKNHSCSEFTPPAVNLAAHVAALGMRFYTGKMFPETYRGRIFIAEHGSWNRTHKQGYRVETVAIKNGKAAVFAEGWLEGEEAWGRPVDVLVMPDGALLVSDDLAGAIYRISYQ